MTSPRPLALITGASSGLGAEFARQLAAQGYDLALVARRKDRLEELARELSKVHGVKADVLTADLTRDADLRAVEDYLTRAPNLELLVNNAGFGTMGRFFEIDLASQEAMHRLHVLATTRLTHAALTKMTERNRGAVVNVSSVAGFVPRPGATSYYATKAWMNCFTEGLHLELKNAGSAVRVQALCPGFTITEFHDTMKMDRGQVLKGWWMSAREVVAASLRGLKRGKLFVVPGWRYQLLVVLLRVLPRFLIHLAVTKGPAGIRREVKPPAKTTQTA